MSLLFCCLCNCHDHLSLKVVLLAKPLSVSHLPSQQICHFLTHFWNPPAAEN